MRWQTARARDAHVPHTGCSGWNLAFFSVWTFCTAGYLSVPPGRATVALERSCPGKGPNPPAVDWKELYLARGERGVTCAQGRELQKCCTLIALQTCLRTFLAFLWHDCDPMRHSMWWGRDAEQKKSSWRRAGSRSTWQGPVFGVLLWQGLAAAAVLEFVPENKPSLAWQLCREQENLLLGMSLL